ncbi:MAG: ATP-binding protein [Spirochaetes bacterium]|nr:ATP-binding protein [Spirochaetota bacterium]
MSAEATSSRAPYATRSSAKIIAEEKAKILELGLLHAEKMKSLGIMVAGLAHEINNPNQFIATSISFLRDAWMSIEPIINEYLLANDDFLVAGVSYSGNASSIRELFDKTAQSTWKIKMIVDSLLGYSRKGSTLLTDTVDVNQAIDNALTLVGGSLKKKSAGIVMERDGHLPAIRGNRQQIEQVLVNLFTNACQALTGTGQRIFLNTGRDASGNIQITVRDEGCGMSDDELKNIMTPFFTTKRDSGGVGLGLFICSNIVKDHKGTIVFSTKQGEGTTVQVSFPPAV